MVGSLRQRPEAQARQTFPDDEFLTRNWKELKELRQTVVSDGFSWTPLLRFLGQRKFRGRDRLTEDKRECSFLVSPEKIRCCIATQITINA